MQLRSGVIFYPHDDDLALTGSDMQCKNMVRTRPRARTDRGRDGKKQIHDMKKKVAPRLKRKSLRFSEKKTYQKTVPRQAEELALMLHEYPVYARAHALADTRSQADGISRILDLFFKGLHMLSISWMAPCKCDNHCNQLSDGCCHTQR